MLAFLPCVKIQYLFFDKLLHKDNKMNNKIRLTITYIYNFSATISVFIALT